MLLSHGTMTWAYASVRTPRPEQTAAEARQFSCGPRPAWLRDSSGRRAVATCESPSPSIQQHEPTSAATLLEPRAPARPWAAIPTAVGSPWTPRRSTAGGPDAVADGGRAVRSAPWPNHRAGRAIDRLADSDEPRRPSTDPRPTWSTAPPTRWSTSAQGRALHAALRRRNWPTTLTELDADHAGVVMTVYDPELCRCVPSDSDRVLSAGHQTAQLIAQAATDPSTSSV